MTIPMTAHSAENSFKLDCVHPFVEGGPFWTMRLESGEETQYQIDFRVALGPAAVAYALHDPLRSAVPDAGIDDISRGLKKLTYPNSKISRSVDSAPLPGVDSAHRLDVRDDARVLAEHLDNFQEGPRRTYIRAPYLTEVTARMNVLDSLHKVKPLEFKTIADEAGILVDDLAIKRAKIDRGGARRVRIDDYLAALSFEDRELLVEYFCERDYVALQAYEREGSRHHVRVPRDLLPPQFRPGLVETAMLRIPSDTALEGNDVITCVLRLDYWQPKNVSTAFARIGWMRHADGGRSLHAAAAERRWNPIRNQYDLTSYSLGAALLANASDIDYDRALAGVLPREGRWPRRQPYPRHAGGVLPVLLRYRQDDLLAQSYISEAEKAIDAQRR